MRVTLTGFPLTNFVLNRRQPAGLAPYPKFKRH